MVQLTDQPAMSSAAPVTKTDIPGSNDAGSDSK
jgi:hypothetical protein